MLGSRTLTVAAGLVRLKGEAVDEAIAALLRGDTAGLLLTHQSSVSTLLQSCTRPEREVNQSERGEKEKVRE